MLKVGVIFGGMSSEKEISLATGRYVYSLLNPQLFEGVAIYMDGDGNLWVIPDKLVIQNSTADVEEKLDKEGKRVVFRQLPNLVDLLFITLLGKYGEDGSIQGVLELLDLPYTGSGVLASAIGMNKKVHKSLLRGAGFTVPKDILVASERLAIAELSSEIKSSFNYPCVVKPVAEGSSVGVAFVREENELEEALEAAFQYDPEALVEEYIEGTEFMCVVLGNDNPEAMEPTEVDFAGPIHTYDSKYMPGRARYHTPPRLEENVIKEIQETAIAVYKLIGAKGYGRVDGYVFKDEIIIGEPHTGTIMVPSSYVFQQAARHKASLKGQDKKALSPRDLVTKIIELAQEAHEEKKGPLG